ncbi:MAG: B12-binding domain-containing protein [Gemmatimonadaceae bacterium]
MPSTTTSAAPISVQASELVERYLDAQLAGDRRAALRLVMDEGLARGLSVEELLLGVVQPAQERIGELWQQNRVSVAQEHLATAISQLVVTHLYQYLKAGAANGKVVIVACAEGEQHELGARMASDFLEMAGFSVRFLGANVPAESLALMVAAVRPDVVVISASTTLCFPGLRRSVEAVRARVGDSIPILVGGTAFRWSETCVADGVRHAGRTARELVDATREAARL